MKFSRSEIVTSLSGLSVLVFVVIEALCKAAAGPRPSLNDSSILVSYMSWSASSILGSVIADTFVLASMTVFLAGILNLAYRKLGRITMAMVVGALFAVIYVTITLFGDSFDAGTALDAIQSVGDANVIRTLIEAHIIVFGPLGGIILAGVASAFGILIIESRLLPRWVAVTGFVKPVQKAFTHLADELGAPINELIFIDDTPKSLSSALEVGFTPILFTGYEQLLNDLANLGINTKVSA